MLHFKGGIVTIDAKGCQTNIMDAAASLHRSPVIRDAEAGDLIDLDSVDMGTVEARASNIVLADTARLDDYADAAINALGADADDATWFVYGGHSNIVKSGHRTAGDGFVNGEDSIIRIAGVVGFTKASYNQTLGLLELG